MYKLKFDDPSIPDCLLQRDETMIGRGRDCDFMIDKPEVSRHHCKVYRNYDVLTLEDLSSSNGTYLNNHLVEGRVVIEDGDLIRFNGKYTATLCLDPLSTHPIKHHPTNKQKTLPQGETTFTAVREDRIDHIESQLERVIGQVETFLSGTSHWQHEIEESIASLKQDKEDLKELIRLNGTCDAETSNRLDSLIGDLKNFLFYSFIALSVVVLLNLMFSLSERDRRHISTSFIESIGGREVIIETTAFILTGGLSALVYTSKKEKSKGDENKE